MITGTLSPGTASGSMVDSPHRLRLSLGRNGYRAAKLLLIVDYNVVTLMYIIPLGRLMIYHVRSVLSDLKTLILPSVR